MSQAHGLHKLKMLRKFDGFGVFLEVINKRKHRCHLLAEALKATYQLVFCLIYLLKSVQFTNHIISFEFLVSIFFNWIAIDVRMV